MPDRPMSRDLDSVIPTLYRTTRDLMQASDRYQPTLAVVEVDADHRNVEDRLRALDGRLTHLHPIAGLHQVPGRPVKRRDHAVQVPAHRAVRHAR